MLNNDLTAGNTIINHIIKELINYVKSPPEQGAFTVSYSVLPTTASRFLLSTKPAARVA